MKRSEPIHLVCAPATQPLTLAGSSFEHSCSKCGQRVMMAPSGQARLKAGGTVTIICLDCFDPPVRYKRGELSAPNREALAAELATVQPNTWKERN